jgi:phosphopantetheine adenylyltransferase
MLSRGWTFEGGKHKVHALLGPGSFDPIREMHIYASAKGKTEKIAIHNLQHTSKGGEDLRVERLHDLEKVSERLIVSSTPMD